VAIVNDVPAEHLQHVKHIPAQILARLSRAEVRLRCAEMERFHRDAAKAPAEHARFLAACARQAGRSEPVADYVERQAELSRLERSADSTLQRLPDGSWGSLAGVYRQMRRKHRDDNRYPPGLDGDVDAAMLGCASTPEAVEIADAHRARAGS
jgi:hypothetical protein